MTRTIIAALIAALPLEMAAAEDAPTVQELLPACTRATDLSLSGAEIGTDGVLCGGVAMGVLSTMQANCRFAQAGGEVPFGWLAAAPTPLLSSPAAARVFVNWANAHPETWSDEIMTSIARAMSETFPCEAG